MADPNVNYLRFLADFWIHVYRGEVQRIEGSLEAQAEILKSFFFTFLQRQLPPNIRSFPIFQEHFWNVIELKQDAVIYLDIDNKVTTKDKAVFSQYILDEAYAHIPYLYNVIYDPSYVLKEGTYDELIKTYSPGELILNNEYFNTYDLPVTNGTQILSQNTKFFAESDFFVVPSGATGNIKENKDYCLFVDINNTFNVSDAPAVLSYLRFKIEKDPFSIPAIPQKTAPNGLKSIALFAPKVYIDKMELYQYFGAVVGVYSKSSVDYKNFLEGLFYLYTHGPTVSALNAGFNVCYGYPVARVDENIIKVYVSEDYFTLKSDLGNEYQIKRRLVEDISLDGNGDLLTTQVINPILKLSGKRYFDPRINNYRQNGDFSNPQETPPDNQNGYDVYYPVTALDGFLDNLKIVDYQTQPKWWLEKVNAGNFHGIRSMPIVPGQDLRKRLSLIDYMFENVLKHNTFGIFVDTKSLSDFEGIKDFYRIISEVKPTWKTFLITEQGITIYSEMQIFDTLQLDVSVSSDPNFQPLPLPDPEIPGGIGSPPPIPTPPPTSGIVDIVDSINVAIKHVIPILSVHDFDLKLGMDWAFIHPLGFNELDTPDPTDELSIIVSGLELHKVGASYDIARLLINLKSSLGPDGLPTPGSIYSEHTLLTHLPTPLELKAKSSYIAKKNETINKVQVFSDRFVLKTNQNNTYTIPRTLEDVGYIDQNNIPQLKTIAKPILHLSNKNGNIDFSDPTIALVGQQYTVDYPVLAYENLLDEINYPQTDLEDNQKLGLLPTEGLFEYVKLRVGDTRGDGASVFFMYYEGSNNILLDYSGNDNTGYIDNPVWDLNGLNPAQKRILVSGNSFITMKNNYLFNISGDFTFLETVFVNSYSSIQPIAKFGGIEIFIDNGYVGCSLLDSVTNQYLIFISDKQIPLNKKVLIGVLWDSVNKIIEFRLNQFVLTASIDLNSQILSILGFTSINIDYDNKYLARKTQYSNSDPDYYIYETLLFGNLFTSLQYNNYLATLNVDTISL